MALADRLGFGTYSHGEDTGDLQVEIGMQAG